jgi:hypothetical protein
MAKRPRKSWSQLTPGYRSRITRAVSRKTGLSDKQIRERYNRGTLGSLSQARGHAATPEHPYQAQRNPLRYREYIAKNQPQSIIGGSPADKRLRTLEHIERLLGDYFKFSTRHVIDSVNKMTDSELEWTLNADVWDIRGRAAVQVPGHESWLADSGQRNQWFYH